jgi:hypothetical protein
MTTPLFDATARGHLPGDLLDTGEISPSTLRRWESYGWIRDAGASRLVYLVLTIEGYRTLTGDE